MGTHTVRNHTEAVYESITLTACVGDADGCQNACSVSICSSVGSCRTTLLFFEPLSLVNSGDEAIPFKLTGWSHEMSSLNSCFTCINRTTRIFI